MADILVIEDEQLIARLLKETLEMEGYQVAVVLNGKDAIPFALHEMPHLIIVDVMLPIMDGYEVIQQLRNHPKTMHIPILALSALGEPIDKIRAYDSDVDGYITKPFNTAELLARVRRQLRRIRQSCLSPLTGLPGGLQVVRAINYKLCRPEPWSILYLDLDNFKAFNDVYGFLTGNDMIVLVSNICQKVVYEHGNADDFIGHVGGDDFIVVTTPEPANILCTQILSRYKEESIQFYRSEDVRRGSISGVDRKGRPYQFPLVSLSIGIVNSQRRRPYTIQEVSYMAAEAKRHAKLSSNNIFHVPFQPDKTYTDHSSPGNFSSSFPPSFACSLGMHAFHDVLHFVEKDTMAEC